MLSILEFKVHENHLALYVNNVGMESTTKMQKLTC